MKVNMKKILIGFGAFLAGALIVLTAFRLMWVTRVEIHEAAYNVKWLTGELEVFTNSGWVVRAPVLNSVHCIDLRPVQLTISANQRVLNAKLVRFDIKGIKTFIEWHGRGAGSMGGMEEILKCYAFDSVNGADCPFLEVIQEIAPNQGILSKSTNSVEKCLK